jgi:nicotinamide mononucleotide adenylyltransferase/predicted kinase
MKSFLNLMEEETKSVAMLFGRMNPPTKGHEENVNGLKDYAAKHNADHVVVASGSHDPKKNPLSPEDKAKHLKRAFPQTNIKVADKEHPTILHWASAMHKQGYTHLHVMAGADRADEYKRLLTQYNGKEGKHGHYNFKKITVHSTGERQAGVSGTDMRNHVKKNDYESFKNGLPSAIQANDKHAKELFHDTKKGMGIHENVTRGMFKALFLVGGPGSGKDVIIHEAISERNATEINANKAYEFLMDKKKLSEETKDYQLNAIRNRTALVINGASDDQSKITSIKEELDELGYTSMMVFVNTTNEVSQDRNNQHARVISEQIRQEKWKKSQSNLDHFYDVFDYFLEFDNSINLQSQDLLIKEAKQNEISDICNEISYFYKTKVINEVATQWLQSNGKLNKKDELNEKYTKLLKKGYGKGFEKALQKQNLRAKGMPTRMLKDNNAPVDQMLRKSGKQDDVRDGDIQSNSSYTFRTYEEKALSQEAVSPSLKVSPEPKTKAFDTDKESPKMKRKAGVSLLPGKAMQGSGVGNTFDTRTSGSVYPMSGLGNTTYNETFDKFRKKIKSESIDEPGTSEMGMYGGMGNGADKEPMQTPLDKFMPTDVKKKAIKKRFNK